jgi:hypothetical protein
MCIYLIRNDNDAAQAISLILRADPAGTAAAKDQDAIQAACLIIRCQKPLRCIGDAIVVR